MSCKDDFQLIKQGAEARLYKTEYFNKPTVVKERFKKNYRNDILDENILKERTRAEARGILRSKIAGVRTPTLYMVDIETRMLYMEYIDGMTVKDYIDKMQTPEGQDNQALNEIMDKIGFSIAKIHSNDLIHGDLTTSNMLVDKYGHLFLIDFGLSYVSTSAEDKGVDLYVLERALTSTHASADVLFQTILKSYSTTYENISKEVLKKYEEVKARGRKRTMVG